MIVDHPLRRSGTDANVPLRGVEPAAFRVHTDVQIIEGRNFQPGTERDHRRPGGVAGSSSG